MHEQLPIHYRRGITRYAGGEFSVKTDIKTKAMTPDEKGEIVYMTALNINFTTNEVLLADQQVGHYDPEKGHTSIDKCSLVDHKSESHI